MAIPVSGTFAGTGNSASFIAREALLNLTFAGTATVNVQAKFGANWRTIGTYTATPPDGICYDGPKAELRLNCSAHTNNVTYEVWVSDSENVEVIPAA